MSPIRTVQITHPLASGRMGIVQKPLNNRWILKHDTVNATFVRWFIQEIRYVRLQKWNIAVEFMRNFWNAFFRSGCIPNTCCWSRVLINVVQSGDWSIGKRKWIRCVCCQSFGGKITMNTYVLTWSLYNGIHFKILIENIFFLILTFSYHWFDFFWKLLHVVREFLYKLSHRV